jgi:hypothetical protein
MYNQAWQQAQGVAQRPFQPYSYDPNAFVAPLNQVQLGAVNEIGQLQGSANPFYAAGAGMVGNAGTTSSAGILGNYTNPYMSQVVDPIKASVGQQQQMQQQQLNADQIKAGAFGQERGQLMRAVLAGQQNMGLGQALSPLYQDAYKTGLSAAQTDLNRQMQSGQIMGGLGSGLMQSNLGAANALLGAGTLGQQTQQAGLQSLYNQYLMQQQYPFQQAQFLSSIAAGLGPGYGGTTSGFQNSMQPLSYFGNPLSDPALKVGAEGDKPEVIGETNDGQPIYRYRVINPDTGETGPVQIGLMADEVEQRRPDAIGDYKGFRTVDYEKATDGAARMGGGVMGRGDYADGGGVEDILAAQKGMYQNAGAPKGIIPEVQMQAARLDTPTLSYQQPQRETKKGFLSQLGETAGTLLDLYKTGAEAKSIYDNWGKKKAGGGGVYDDDVEMSHGPTGDIQQPTANLDTPTLSYQQPERQKESNPLGDILGTLGTIVGIGSKVAPMLSDRRLKTGVRPGRADGGGFLDDLANALAGHGYITGETWERPRSEPIDVTPGLRPHIVHEDRRPVVSERPRSMGVRPAPVRRAEIAAPVPARPAGVRPEPSQGQYGPVVGFNSSESLGAPMMPSDRFTPFEGRYGPVVGFKSADARLGSTPIMPSSRFTSYDQEMDTGDTLTPYEYARLRELHEGNRPMGMMVGMARGGSADEEDLFDRLLNQESGRKQFDRDGRPITSSKGATGIAQVMPGTMPDAARYAGLEPDAERLRNDPDYNKALGRAYLKHQLDAFGGDEEKALAAYNAGPRRVNDALAKASASGGDWRDYLPAETRAYIPAIMGGKGGLGDAMAYAGKEPGPSFPSTKNPPRGVVPSSDEAPAQGLAGMIRGAPAKDMGEKAGDFLTSERFLVPLATGLGAMASSGSRFLGPAILQGLGAGAQSYMSVQKAQADIAKAEEEARTQKAETAARSEMAPKIRAETQKQLIDNFKSSIYTTPYGNFVFLENGMPVSQADYMEMWRQGKAPKTLGQVPKDAAQLVQSTGASAGTQVDANGQPEAAPSQTPSSAADLPKAAPQSIEVPSDIYDKRSIDAARAEQRIAMNGGPLAEAAMKTTDQYRTYVNGEVTGARENAPYVKELSTTLADAYARRGFDEPGFKAGLRSEVSSFANTLYHMLGGDPDIDLSKLKDSQDVVNKISTLLATQRSAAGGQHAYAALEAIKGAIPNLEMDKGAGAELTAQLMALQQRAVDRDAHLRAYQKDSNGLAVDAADDFTKKSASRYQMEQKILKDLMLHRPEALKIMMSGAGVTPAQIEEKMKKWYGKKAPSGMWRYFAPAR